MGFTLAEECARRGAKVILVAGPVQQKINHPNIHRIDIESAEEMYTIALQEYPKADVGILCAAVADFTPDTIANKKIKRESDNTLTLQLKPTTDIATCLGKIKRPEQHLIGFALETNDELQNARDKLRRKNFDFIVLNSLNDKGAGFRYDTNKISIIDNERKIDYHLKQKTEVAKDITNRIVKELKEGRI
jgi:phosphopantothenoylcysteine decarboxylase/phosphopantothenate--cysteine ligase